jgi:hypothetical protein
LAGSTFLKASILVLAGFGWGALGPGGREPAPSALAAFFVVLMFSLLMWFLEYQFASRLEEEGPITERTRPEPPVHRAKDYVRRYPEKKPFAQGDDSAATEPTVYNVKPLPRMIRPIEPFSSSELGEDNPSAAPPTAGNP